MIIHKLMHMNISRSISCKVNLPLDTDEGSEEKAMHTDTEETRGQARAAAMRCGESADPRQ